MSTIIAGRSWMALWRQRLWRLAPRDRDPVVLRHSRIYILPTQRGLALMATVLLMLITSMNYALSLGFAMSFVCAGMVAAALLAAFRNLAGIAVSPMVGGETFAGGQLEFTLSLASGGRARAGVEVSARDAQAVDVELPAGATRPVRLHVHARTRGRRALGRVTLSTTLPLGLWRGWAYVHFPLTGSVYPAPEASPPPLPTGDHGSGARRAALVADAELTGLREYQRGDPQNRIAWKAVARGAGWYTKLFEGAGGSGAVDLDWAELPQGMDVEQRLSRLAAWILVAERETRAFSLRLPGMELAQGQGAGHRRAALLALALYPDAGTHDG